MWYNLEVCLTHSSICHIMINCLKTCLLMNGKLMLTLFFEELFILFTQANAIDQTGAESGLKLQTDKLPALPKVRDMTGNMDRVFHMKQRWMFNILSQCKVQTSDNLLPFPTKLDQTKTPPPARPPAPQVDVDGRSVIQNEEPTMANLQAEIKELRRALDLLQRRQEWVLLFKKQESFFKICFLIYSCKSTCTTRH